MVKNLPAMQETQVLSLGWEDPLEKGMAIHSSTLVWRIPWTEVCPYSIWTVCLRSLWSTFFSSVLNIYGFPNILIKV